MFFTVFMTNWFVSMRMRWDGSDYSPHTHYHHGHVAMCKPLSWNDVRQWDYWIMHELPTTTHDFTYRDSTCICYTNAHGHFMNYSPSLETLLLICSDRESSSLARAGADSDSCGDKRNICRLFNLIQPHFQTKCPPPHPLFRDNN